MHEEKNQQRRESIAEILKFSLIVLAIVVPFRLWIAQPYIVEGSSMDPTFKNGDYLIVDQVSYQLEEPKRGEVIIMRYPKDPSKYFIKRIIGLPEETVLIENGKVFIKPPGENILLELDESYVVYDKTEEFSATLKENEYFVMGDNRAGSSDSRVWGPLPAQNIVGRPFIRLLPITKIKILPGSIDEIVLGQK
jgi:signal peptidase I